MPGRMLEENQKIYSNELFNVCRIIMLSIGNVFGKQCSRGFRNLRISLSGRRHEAFLLNESSLKTKEFRSIIESAHIYFDYSLNKPKVRSFESTLKKF